MKRLKIYMLLFACIASMATSAKELFPDGTPVPDWFREIEKTDISKLGKQYRITDFGVVNDSTILQTEKIQAVIDQAYQAGGGVVVVPQGTYQSGSLFFKQGTHLHVEAGGVLKGSDDIANFPLVMTRMEGQTLKYFAALVNADGVDGFTISGKGTIDGNGLRYWRAFWLRRQFNSKCTNMDEMRPRLVYISNSKNIQLQDVHLKNSPFWTTHLYKCEYVKLLGLRITSPEKPVKAPSTDAVDLDVCSNILIKNCYMSVNDDAVALKGGKGPQADKDPSNGGNYNIIIEDCTYGFCHSALTCGSEAIHNRNIIFRRVTVDSAKRMFQLKMRPDTPQHYEYILLEDITGNASSMLDTKPWTQFFDLKGENGMRLSKANDIVFRNVKLECKTAFDVIDSDQYQLSDFTFENMDVQAERISARGTEMFKGLVLKNMKINGTVFKGEKAQAKEEAPKKAQWNE
ncbi:exopolygalacturonase [Bacteroides sp. 214]|uniref:rhamnogalacturonidase n=1 Tax=Bacteroides sp. 214 TaxID=2302935 RepID=UPI0013D74A09|nr:glycosyl hydrolase family 28 protein [Bacteroides sp. 214]NDW11457.1 exopolygalacturonase [Bacteroides sp. 214]